MGIICVLRETNYRCGQKERSVAVHEVCNIEQNRRAYKVALTCGVTTLETESFLCDDYFADHCGRSASKKALSLARTWVKERL
jgi:hypothetical protein